MEKIEIPFGASDSDGYYEEIIIPEGLEAIMEDGRIILRRKESDDDKIRKKFIKLVKISSEVGGFALQKWEAEEMLTWLKKQGQKQLNSWNNAKDIKAPSNKDILAWYRKNDGVLEGSPKVVWFCSDEESAKETDLAYWIECPDEKFDKTYWFEKQEQVKETAISLHKNKV